MDDNNSKDNTTTKDLIGWIKKNNRAARAARFLVQSAKWRREVFIYNASSQQLIFHSLPLQENHSCQAGKRQLNYFVQSDQQGIIARH